MTDLGYKVSTMLILEKEEDRREFEEHGFCSLTKAVSIIKAL